MEKRVQLRCKFFNDLNLIIEKRIDHFSYSDMLCAKIKVALDTNYKISFDTSPELINYEVEVGYNESIFSFRFADVNKGFLCADTVGYILTYSPKVTFSHIGSLNIEEQDEKYNYGFPPFHATTDNLTLALSISSIINIADEV